MSFLKISMDIWPMKPWLFFENDLFYGVDNFVQISEKDVSLYQKLIGNVSEINTIDYFYGK